MSRELDAEIAEKVMGRPSTYVPPPYSTDFAAAWLIIEKMRADGWWYTLTDEQRNGAHFAEFRKVAAQGVHRFYSERAATAPLAICRAALAAMKGAQG